MPHHKPESFLLSNEADKDLDAIFDYTEAEHGFDQAVKYLSDFDSLFGLLVKNPKIGRERKEIRKDIHSIVEQQHTIFNKIQEDHILIVRILHSRSDIPKNFSIEI